jgi:hypothetical protein
MWLIGGLINLTCIYNNVSLNPNSAQKVTAVSFVASNIVWNIVPQCYWEIFENDVKKYVESRYVTYL